jgi:hypothetical protein
MSSEKVNLWYGVELRMFFYDRELAARMKESRTKFPNRESDLEQDNPQESGSMVQTEEEVDMAQRLVSRLIRDAGIKVEGEGSGDGTDEGLHVRDEVFYLSPGNYHCENLCLIRMYSNTNFEQFVSACPPGFTGCRTTMKNGGRNYQKSSELYPLTSRIVKSLSIKRVALSFTYRLAKRNGPLGSSRRSRWLSFTLSDVLML